MPKSIYLAAPEVENDRRALNTFYGMRRARKEGRYLTTGPYGYVNRTIEGNRKIIEPFKPKAAVVRWAFEQIAIGQYAVDQIRKEVNQKGLNCSKSNFYTLLRNPVYCGKIVVPEYRDEPKQIVAGQHEPIISEALFYQVQDVLNGKKRLQLTKLTSLDHLPLRGLLICPKCSKLLCGSSSKGRKHYYTYYHCNSICGVRYKADEVNDIFLKDLEKFIPKKGVAEVYKLVIKDICTQHKGSKANDRKDLLNQIQTENDRLSKARKLLLDDAIDSGDYKIIKAECENKLLSLEAKLTNYSKITYDVELFIDKAVSTLSMLDSIYMESDTARK